MTPAPIKPEVGMEDLDKLDIRAGKFREREHPIPNGSRAG
jgi:hypothetical protein